MQDRKHEPKPVQHRQYGERQLSPREFGEDFLNRSGRFRQTLLRTVVIPGMMRKYSKAEQSWRLRLANNRNWTFAAGASLAPWLSMFAGTMMLRQSKPTEEGPRLLFRRTRKLPTTSGESGEKGGITLRREGSDSDWSCTFNRRRGKKRDIDFMRHSLMAVYMDAVDGGGFPCHAGLLAWGGRGVLVAGASGTGKSTTCCRLLSTGAVLCDEETLIVRDRQGRYWGHPCPTWSRLFDKPGSQRWEVERAVPLQGTIFLFPAGQDQCVPVGQGEAAAKLHRMAMDKAVRSLECLDEETFLGMKKRMFDNVCLFVSQVPVTRLNVTLASDMEKEFAKACQCLWQKPPQLHPRRNLRVSDTGGHAHHSGK